MTMQVKLTMGGRERRNNRLLGTIFQAHGRAHDLQVIDCELLVKSSYI